ncbi:CBS domain-containing protein [Piscinibacter sp.]|jgi:CBS domain-containing protein|uniref:CBS domain-containing protein n=1 Tax=Piscinibacter sp. TaxID=1903157 RepID=UPI00355994AC
MKIGSICTPHVISIDASGSLKQAATLMREHHVGALVVTTEGQEGLRVSGIVTDRDLVIDVLARGLNADDVKIGALAQTRVVLVSENADLAEAITAMKESGVRRLLVRNDDDSLSGIVSLDDLMDACAFEIAGLAMVIRSGIEREAGKSAASAPAAARLRIPAMGTAAWTSVVL